MARIRTIKPEFWSHPVLSRLDDAARLGAIGLLNYADDEGYFLAEPAAVRSFIWPLDDDSSKARRVLDELVRVGYVEIVQHPEQGAVGRIVKFGVHQRVDRPNPSKTKRYFLSANDRRTTSDASPNDRRSVVERSSQEQGTGNREQGTGKGEKPARARARDALPPLTPRPDWLPPEWEDYERHRCVVGRRTWTELARKKALVQLARWRDEGYDLSAVINASIANGWTGLFARREHRLKGAAGAKSRAAIEAFVQGTADAGL